MQNAAIKNDVPQKRTRLIELRKRVGTQRKVAADLGITDAYLRMLESGVANPGVDLLFRIAHYFGVDVYECWPDLAGDRPYTHNQHYKP